MKKRRGVRTEPLQVEDEKAAAMMPGKKPRKMGRQTKGGVLQSREKKGFQGEMVVK